MIEPRLPCDHDPDELQLYVDGAASAPRQAAVAARLPVCASCREELQLLLSLDALTRSLPAVAEPAGFTASVLDRLPVRTPAFRVGWRDAAIAASLLVVLVGLHHTLGPLLPVLSDDLTLAWLDPTRSLEVLVIQDASPVWLGLVQAAFWGLVGLAIALAARAVASLWQV
ncbi:MAG: hypothetical protein HY329_08490 [Chloroflexi bacterium]|nr:hypothetical protein [Chloroflexota bacterium]